MNKTLFAVIVLAVYCAAGHAQNRVYRCGNEYTNVSGAAKRAGCRPVEGGNVTIIEGSVPARPAAAQRSGESAAPRQATSPAGAPKVSATAQRDRDRDARTILDTELKKSQERLAELKAEYNDGAPVRSALELRNPQSYIERTASLKADIDRTEADIEGIEREIARLR